MCGIAGTFNYRHAQPVDSAQLKRMADNMSHRGPDDEGFHISGPVGLAHRRLSIIDVGGGHQPMSNEDDTVWIVFNGEIYNHRELRPILEAKGHRYKTDCDTETILHAYEQYGEHCVEKLRGMFAFAIWDQRARRLLLARDRLGIKPLYYLLEDDRLFFGSEIKALLATRSSGPTLDMESLDCYLSLSYVPAPWTLFEGIVKLPPGHLMTVTEDKVTVQPYWDLHYGPKSTKSDAELEEELGEVLTETVKSHLMSEVPLGVFLSGGLDSGFLTANMTNRLGVPCQTFTIGYEDDGEESELAEARRVAKQFGTTHHEYRIGAMDMVKEFPTILWHLEEPLASTATIPLYFLAKAAREHVTVVLSGEGADELLGGYSRYRQMLLAERFHQMGALRPVWAGLRGLLRDTRAGRFCYEAGLPLERRYLGVASAFWPSERRHLLTPHFFDARLEQTLARHHGQSAHEEALDRLLYFDTKVYLVDDLLLKADKMTMAASMELRVPFLDHRVVEFCARLPTRLKLNGTTTKVLLRRLLKTSLPPDHLRRPKKGFPVPLARWFQCGLRDHITQNILDPGSLSRRLFKPEFLATLIRRAESGVETNARKLWALYQLEQWKTVFGVRL